MVRRALIGIWVAVTACLLLAARPPSCQAQDRVHHVLVINSLQQGVPWTRVQMSAIESVLTGAELQVQLHVDYMHAKRIKLTPNYLLDKFRLLDSEFRSLRFDVVICSGIDALRFVMTYGERLFPGTPVIFCAISRIHRAYIDKHPLYKGLYYDEHFPRNIELALKLFPDTNEIVFTHDQTSEGLAMAAAMRAVAARFTDLRFRFVTNMDIGEMQDSVGRLPQGSVLIPGPLTVDKSGRFFVAARGVELVARASSVPPLGLYHFELDHGVLGGYLTDSAEYGRLAAELALQVLKGESIRDIPSPEVPGRYVFDHEVMQRFGVSPSALPKGSAVVNKPPSLMKQHGGLVVGVSALLAALVGAVAVLGLHIRLRERAEEARRRFEEEISNQKRHFYRETIFSVTQGKLEICDPSEVELYVDRAELREDITPEDVSIARHAAEAYCRNKGLAGDDLDAFVLGIGEAVANAVKHAPEGQVHAGTDGASVWVAVTDTGPGIDSLLLPRATLLQGFSTKPSLGLGFTIMLDVADRVLLATGREGTTVVLIKKLPATSAGAGG